MSLLEMYVNAAKKERKTLFGGAVYLGETDWISRITTISTHTNLSLNNLTLNNCPA